MASHVLVSPGAGLPPCPLPLAEALAVADFTTTFVESRLLEALTASICAGAGATTLHVVANTTKAYHAGLFNPFTASGTIVVDGVVASVQSRWFADDVMDRLGLTHAIPALYQARPLTQSGQTSARQHHGRMCGPSRLCSG